MTSKNNQRFTVNFGFSTILLAFVMICVITFSALTLVTANSDYKLSQKVAKKNAAYYQAQEKVYEELRELDELCIQCFLSSHTEKDYYSSLRKQLTTYEITESDTSGYYLQFSQPVDTNQYLTVKLYITYPHSDTEAFYEIVEWKSEYEQSLPEDTFMDLID